MLILLENSQALEPWGPRGHGPPPHFLETIVKTMAKVNKICDWPPHLDICSNAPGIVLCWFILVLQHIMYKQKNQTQFNVIKIIRIDEIYELIRYESTIIKYGTAIDIHMII